MGPREEWILFLEELGWEWGDPSILETLNTLHQGECGREMYMQITYKRKIIVALILALVLLLKSKMIEIARFIILQENLII